MFTIKSSFYIQKSRERKEDQQQKLEMCQMRNNTKGSKAISPMLLCAAGVLIASAEGVQLQPEVLKWVHNKSIKSWQHYIGGYLYFKNIPGILSHQGTLSKTLHLCVQAAAHFSQVYQLSGGQTSWKNDTITFGVW